MQLLRWLRGSSWGASQYPFASVFSCVEVLGVGGQFSFSVFGDLSTGLQSLSLGSYLGLLRGLDSLRFTGFTGAGVE